MTFHLGDTDRDDHLSEAEGIAFAKEHVQEASPLSKALGLSGGHVALADEAAAASAVPARATHAQRA